MKLQAQVLAWTTAVPFWMQMQTLLLFFFSLQEALRLIFVRGKLFESGRNFVCVALPEILTNSSLHSFALGLALCNVCIWDISVLLPENSQLNPSPDLHGRDYPCKGNHALWGPPWYSFFGADHPDMFTLLQKFPPGDENSFSQFPSFCPLGDTKVVSQLGASSHQFVTNPGTALFLREQWVLVPQGLKGRKEGGDLAGAQGWDGTRQWTPVCGFMFVSWRWAQGPCCGSRSGECLIFSYLSIIPSPLTQSFPVLRGWEFGSAFANRTVLHSKDSWVLAWEGGELWWKCFDLHKVLAAPFFLLSWLPFPWWILMPQGTITDGLQRRISVLFSEIFHCSKGNRFFLSV